MQTGIYKVKCAVIGNPKVTILIPNKDQKETLQNCIQSILEKTTYQNYEIAIIENNSEEEETFAYYQELEKNEKIKVLYYPEKVFNYSGIINFGVKNTAGELIVQLNNDTEVLNPKWLEEMVGYAQREAVGAVGAKLYYPDGTIQHAGVAMGLFGLAGHLFVGLPKDSHGYWERASMIQDVSAVTAACIMTRREIYEQVGFMNETLAVAFNDIDFCLKIRELGKLIVYHPYVEFVHYESKTRGYEDTPEKQERFSKEVLKMQEMWKAVLEKGDPYYNINLRLDSSCCEVKTEKVELENKL